MISYTFKGNDSIITDAVKRLIDNGKLRRDDCPGDWEADRVEVAKMILKETERARNLSAHGTNDENDIIHDLFSKVENGIAVDINFSLPSISAVEKFRRCISQLENETKDSAGDRPRPNTNSRSDSVSEDNDGLEESSETEIEDERCDKNAESEPERIPLTRKRKGRPPTLIDGKRKCRQTRTTKRAATFECSLCTKKCTSMNRLKQHRRLTHNLS
ncbi:hypothetical protein FOZ61_002289 [Perkinsus olseni]|uniref:C2H2-type domain-containing protein n=1 Tax=Perkinsus olseni TaxID=32597 RepID=A0A7J6LTN3_PEROL|nr:hypothetical protein FOZ61_002289 [Perkinsus olseni]